jgi:hypothetical protein
MAEATSLAGKSLLIKVSDGEVTPAFAHPCLINAARGIQFGSQVNERRIPDCADPELIAWSKVNKVQKSATITGAGVLHTPDNEFYFDWFDSDDAIAVRVEFSGVVLADGGGWWAGNFKNTQYDVQGEPGDETQCNITLQSHGTVAWVPAAA